MSLKDSLVNAKLRYTLPDDDVISLVINPALEQSLDFACMSGYFNSQALADLAHGLAAFIQNSDRTFRLLVSPALSKVDQLAIASSENIEEESLSIIETLFSGDVDEKIEALVHHTRLCLAYLLHQNRLEIRVVFLRGGGIFHPKLWLFSDQTHAVTFEGSCNITSAGLSRNVERMSLQKSWDDEPGHILSDFSYFESFWDNLRDGSVTVDARKAVLADLFRDIDFSTQPSIGDYEKALAGSLAPEVGKVEEFFIPKYLVWTTGDFAHQSHAVKAWEANERKGILEMATGAGKTLTSLIAAQRLYKDIGKLLVVIAAPTLVLTAQWVGDCRDFGVEPYLCSSDRLHSEHLTKIQRKIDSVRLGLKSIEIVVMTHELAKNINFQKLMDAATVPVLFIGDEVHRLGVPRFLENAASVGFVLGLSATPSRILDNEGNAGLKKFFGPVVFSFGIEKAIGVCLVPYNYFVKSVHLNQDEFEIWREWQAKIAKFLATCSEKLTRSQQKTLTILARQQRAVLEAASAKVEMLSSQLKELGPPSINNTLIYCTSTNPLQMEQVNSLLNDLSVRFHRVTQEETPNQSKMQEILKRFASGANQVLTAKRVLDEGFNVPEIHTAFILASSTSKREWVQRRGRVLRKSIGKTYADIYDYLVLPPKDILNKEETLTFMSGDLLRLWEFGSISLNKDHRKGITGFINDLKAEHPGLIWPPEVVYGSDDEFFDDEVEEIQTEMQEGKWNTI